MAPPEDTGDDAAHDAGDDAGFDVADDTGRRAAPDSDSDARPDSGHDTDDPRADDRGPDDGDGGDDAEHADSADRTHDDSPTAETRRAAGLSEVVGLDRARYDRQGVLDRVGLPGEETRRWWRAMGLVEAPDGVEAFGRDDVAMAKALKVVLAQEAAAEEHIYRLARLLGGSFSRIAEAQAEVIDDMLEALHDGAGLDTPGERLAALESPEATMLFNVLEDSLLYVWRRHLHTALGRWVGADPENDEQAVGFADISGFSAMSKRMGSEVLEDVIDHFETETVDVVSAHDGRVVKFIGDEALFVVNDLDTAVDVALDLIERMDGADPSVALHCGVARGPTVTIGGDVFGNTVNLASRLTDVARRGKVVLTRGDAEGLGDRSDLRISRIRRNLELKGLGRTQIVNVSRTTNGSA